MPLLAWLTSY